MKWLTQLNSPFRVNKQEVDVIRGADNDTPFTPSCYCSQFRSLQLGTAVTTAQNSLYNCTIRVFGRETGKTVVEGNMLTITPGPGTLEYNHTCRTHLNSKKVTHMDGQRWQWQVVRDEQGVKLCVRDQEGASACYYRQ